MPIGYVIRVDTLFEDLPGNHKTVEISCSTKFRKSKEASIHVISKVAFSYVNFLTMLLIFQQISTTGKSAEQ